jgi:hypothetical protein
MLIDELMMYLRTSFNKADPSCKEYGCVVKLGHLLPRIEENPKATELQNVGKDRLFIGCAESNQC